MILYYFTSQLGFLCPKSIDYTNEISNVNNSFCVVLQSTGLGGVGWVSCNDGTQAAYIYLNYNKTDTFDTVIAHELQHCIQNRYNLTEQGDLWWKESCANWAAMLYADDVLEDLQDRWDEYEDGISKYLNQPILSLANNTGSRVYSALFPMWLAQVYDGALTIRSIYEEVKTIRSNANTMTSQQIFAAVGNVVEDVSDHDLRYILENFGLSNYNAKNFYGYLLEISDEPIVAKKLYFSLVHTKSQDIEYAGYAYYKMTSSPESVMICIETNENYSDFTCWLMEGTWDDYYVESRKYQITAETIYLEFTFQSSYGQDLILILENTSIAENNGSTTVTIY